MREQIGIPRWTILIADDDPGMRQLVRLTLAAPDYQILEAADGDAAWHLLQTHRPHGAILDVDMPGQNGLALTRRVRADPLLRGTLVILLTGLDATTADTLGRQAGADYCLTKPFSPLALLQILETLLGFGA